MKKIAKKMSDIKNENERVFTDKRIFQIMRCFNMSYEDVMKKNASFFFKAMYEINRYKAEKILIAQLPYMSILEIFGFAGKGTRENICEEIFK